MYNLWYFVAFYTVLLPNLFFLAIYAVLSHYRFFRFTHYYVEKNLAKNSARGEKMTNMRYASKYQTSPTQQPTLFLQHHLQHADLMSQRLQLTGMNGQSAFTERVGVSMENYQRPFVEERKTCCTLSGEKPKPADQY